MEMPDRLYWSSLVSAVPLAGYYRVMGEMQGSLPGPLDRIRPQPAYLLVSSLPSYLSLLSI